MDTTGQWRKYTSLMFHFLVLHATLSDQSASTSTAETGSKRRYARPSGYYMAGDAVDTVSTYGTVTLHSHNRLRAPLSFAKSVYSFEVKEDIMPGTVVGKVEATYFKSLAPIVYSVQEDDGENLFLLSPHSGEFLLSRSLDFERQRYYVLTVEVQQGGLQVSSVRVYFNVLDVNDNPPVFRQDTYSASVLEDTHVGTCFLPLNVSDKDNGENGDLDVRVIAGDEDDIFWVNPMGILCLNTELDRERSSSYNLTVTANDCARPLSLRFTSSAQVIILVDDVNDNAPFFLSPESVSTPEDAALHSVVMTVHADDADFGSNGEILYYLDNDSGGLFSIHNTSGNLYLREPLDREQIDKFTITITAIDKGSPHMETSMNLTVHVEDANDHDPEFSQSVYSLTVREDLSRGTSLLQVQAHDLDIGANGQVRYALARGGPFAMDAVRGVVTVMAELDRERDSNYTLIVTAVDRGSVPRFATAVISVTVSDVNDFTPVFSPATVTVHVLENERSPLQHQVSAVDEDFGVNGQLSYLIQTEKKEGFFSLSPNGTFQILQNLDRERESLYIVNIIAVDSGLPPLTGTLTVHVVVDDINDNEPKFTQDVYNTIVYEDSPVGTVFAMITAYDIDEGVSGGIRYSMENGDVPFSIEETSGELFTTGALDRETVAMYTLKVVGRDSHPTHPLSSSVRVTVLIGDVNDNWPQFLNSPYVAYVSTEMTPGSVICAVRATDGDIEMNAELQFSLFGQNSDLFSINPYSGIVFTSSAIRRSKDVTINVHVEDGGEKPKFDISTVSVRFQNASEFPVTHVDVLRRSLSEDEPVGALVAVFSATSSRTELVSFYLASGNLEDSFYLNQLSGELTVETALDYETQKGFTLLVEARDSGSPPFSSFEEIRLNIGDVNDNAPRFTQSEYKCEVFENSLPAWVCDVLAIDADSGSYGVVWYSIVAGNIGGAFTIDSDSGVLSVSLSLDREHIPEYNLTVESTEQDNTLHKDRATVIIVVLDRNDHAPRFSQIFLTEIPEDTPIGHTVIQIISNDDDIGANAMVSYSVIDRNGNIPFSIDSTNGYLTVVRLLDRELQDHYVVTVNANDSAWVVSTDVTVVITDINDNSPVFSQHLYTIVLPESDAQEVFVIQVLATDADIGQNSQILYSVEPPNEVFWVNASSGDIYTKQPLTTQNSASEVLSFIVFAFDCGSVSLYSNTTVKVTLVPYNKYQPIFLPFEHLMAIPYDMAVGSEVVQLSAADQDFNNSSAGVEFVLNGGNASDFFWIQADSGKVILKQSLSESLSVFYTLLIMANDQGVPPLSSQTQITFEITETNRFSPYFSEPRVTFSVPEDLPVGSVIGKIQAQDKDFGANGILKYYITPGYQYPPFSLGKSSGLLTLTEKLDFEIESSYHLRIEVVDGGWLSKTGTLNIIVFVMDINDNPPVFPVLEYISSVLENAEIGATVLHVKATDADSGTNAQITYSLVAGDVDKFAINSRNGTVTTLDVFDYEREQLFDITVKASNIEGPSLIGVAHIVIHILDANEYIPTFRAKEFNFSVFTNVRIGTRIGKVTAYDLDQGYEGQVFYLLYGQNKNAGFEIHQNTGEIYTTGVLRNRGDSHVALRVLAKNQGVITGMDVDEALVQISVIGMNDAPEFTSALYLTSVREDSMVGTSVIAVNAVDQDSMDWNHLSYTIEDGNINTSFEIDPFSGIISVNSPLDREQWPLYNLTITASDNGSPPATGITNVLVVVGDVNDNPPWLMFTQGEVKENQPQGTIVAKLNASDSDLPPNQGPFTYWLVNPEIGGSFSLTPDGVLYTTRPIDREQNPLYHVLVGVKDAGVPPLSSTTTFHVHVLDENDNPPMQRNIYIEVKYYGSSFRGGTIGNVHPEDQDESDTFNCSIKNGPLNMFTIPNGTCELWSTPFQGEATYNITIEATDQLHFPVNNSVYVNYKGFTNASMDSCILFYVSSASLEEFLSHNYLRFAKALDSLFNLQASKTHVFGIKAIGNEILLLAAVKNYSGQYLSREVASGISAGHKTLLEVQSNMTIAHITSDPCLINPCLNGATCNKNIHIGLEVAVLESSAVIFVSPQKEIFNCSCATGFTGTLCEEDVDECEGNPCENKATCVNNPGGFYCHCQSGFSGPLCSSNADECLDLECQNGGLCVHMHDGSQCHCAPGYQGEICEQSVDHCKSSPCVLGTCMNSLTGFSCQCPFGVFGVHCEENSYGFEELAFMEFPPLDPRSNLIYIELATVQQNSLLLFNPGGSSSQEFFALEILDGRAHLSYDLGSGPVRLGTEKQVADGHFHCITARRIGNIGSLLVDNCTDVGNNGFCFAQHDGINSDRTLDVGKGNMTLGGIRSTESILLHPAQIQTHNFVGCFRHIKVNGVLLRPSMALALHDILERCPRKGVSPCHSSPCKNGGVCHDHWSYYVCKCKNMVGGVNCATEMSEELMLRLGENSYIEYMIKERFRRDYLLRDMLIYGINKEESIHRLTEIDIKFKTQNNGVLMFITGKKGYSVLLIKDGKPLYMFEDAGSGHLTEFYVGTEISDGLWHVVSLIYSGQNTLVLLDGQLVMNKTYGSPGFTPLSMDKIVLGAIPPGHSKLKLTGLSGCVEYFKVAGDILPVTGHNEMVEVWPSSTLVQSSCDSPGVCLASPCSQGNIFETTCFSPHCRNLRKCRPSMKNESCICLHHVGDKACGICSSITGSLDRCSEPTPPWLIAVILSVSSVGVIIGLLVALRKHTAGARGPKSLTDSAPQKTEQGTDNVAFCFDDNKTLTDAVSSEVDQPPDIIWTERRRSGVEFYCDADPPGVQTAISNSEPEYYEIDSICSALHSDKASLKFTSHRQLYSKNSVEADPKGWGGKKILFADQTKGNSSQGRRNKSPVSLKTFFAQTQQMPANLDPKLRQDKESTQLQPSYFMGFCKPVVLERVQCLSVEEIRRLNTPRDQIEYYTCQSYQEALRLGLAKAIPMIDVSSGSETDSTFTRSEFEFEQFSFIRSKDLIREQSSLTACTFRQQEVLPVPPVFQHHCHFAEAESALSGTVDQLDNILNMRLHFSSFAEVFEDIAHLPTDISCDCDMQSDLEEVV